MTFGSQPWFVNRIGLPRSGASQHSQPTPIQWGWWPSSKCSRTRRPRTTNTGSPARRGCKHQRPRPWTGDAAIRKFSLKPRGPWITDHRSPCGPALSALPLVTGRVPRRQAWSGLPGFAACSTLCERWRRGWDSNPRYPCRHNGFRDRPDRPLWHPSAGAQIRARGREGRTIAKSRHGSSDRTPKAGRIDPNPARFRHPGRACAGPAAAPHAPDPRSTALRGQPGRNG